MECLTYSCQPSDRTQVQSVVSHKVTVASFDPAARYLYKSEFSPVKRNIKACLRAHRPLGSRSSAVVETGEVVTVCTASRDGNTPEMSMEPLRVVYIRAPLCENRN